MSLTTATRLNSDLSTLMSIPVELASSADASTTGCTRAACRGHAAAKAAHGASCVNDARVQLCDSRFTGAKSATGSHAFTASEAALLGLNTFHGPAESAAAACSNAQSSAGGSGSSGTRVGSNAGSKDDCSTDDRADKGCGKAGDAVHGAGAAGATGRAACSGGSACSGSAGGAAGTGGEAAWAEQEAGVARELGLPANFNPLVTRCIIRNGVMLNSKESRQHSLHLYDLIKKGMTRTAAVVMALTMSIPVWVNDAQARPAAGLPVNISATNATVTHNPNLNDLSIHSTAPNSLLIWDSFNVDAGHSVTFSSDARGAASFLNVVKGGGRSHINGMLKTQANTTGTGPATGAKSFNVYIINPDGITLGTKSSVSGIKNLYLGTAKPDQKLMDRFKDSNPAAAAIGMDSLPDTLGMGKVKMFNRISADNIKVNAGQIVIGEADEVLSVATDKTGLELHSSTGRIDIGGKLDSKMGNQLLTYRQFLENRGLKAAGKDEVNAHGTHAKGLYVDHSDAFAIYEGSDFHEGLKETVNNGHGPVTENRLNQKLWLADDIVLDYDNTPGQYGYEFTGSFDGAFNTITLTGEVRDNGKGNVHGIFGKASNASFSNLKIMSDGLALDSSLNGKELHFGALAGVLDNATVNNVEIRGFELDLNGNALHADSSIGALAGTVKGHNKMSNTTASWSTFTADELSAARTGDKVGNFAGRIDGSIDKAWMVYSPAHTPEHTGTAVLAAVGSGDGSAIAGSFAQAWQKAHHELTTSGMSSEQASDFLYTSYATDGSLADGTLSGRYKGFMQPFFIEDFNFTYDGTSHNYADLVNNEGFDINAHLNKNNGLDYSQSNAGQHEFVFTTSDKSGAGGHDFYFSYSHAGDTWDKNGGGSGSIHDRNNRHDSMSGTGTLNINKKQLTVNIKDQTVVEGTQANTAIDSTTVENIDQITAALGKGDSLADLNLSLKVDPVTGEITAEHNNGNYEIIVNKGNLTVTPKPVPQPQPQPEPQPLPKPEPAPNPQPAPQPMPEPAPLPQPQPVPPVQPEQQFSAADLEGTAGSQTKCQNCNSYESADLQGLLSLHNLAYMDLSQMDYTTEILAALDDGIAPEKLGAFIAQRNSSGKPEHQELPEQPSPLQVADSMTEQNTSEQTGTAAAAARAAAAASSTGVILTMQAAY